MHGDDPGQSAAVSGTLQPVVIWSITWLVTIMNRRITPARRMRTGTDPENNSKQILRAGYATDTSING